MKIALVSAIALLAAAGAASAQDGRVQDAEFVSLARCAALEASLEKPGALSARYRAERDGRTRNIRNDAEQVHERVRKFAATAGMKQERAYEAELNGQCQRFAGGGGGTMITAN